MIATDVPAVRPARRLFAHSRRDAVPVVCAIAQAAFVVTWFLAFDRIPWWLTAVFGLVYAVSISWNINGIAHNFIHNPYFVSGALNRAFSFLESLTLGFSQTFYDCVHMRHHQGNSDRPDAKGGTVDWLSIYRHGRNGEPESAWKYTFASYFRDDPKAIYREIRRKSVFDARFGVLEIVSFLALFGLGFALNWRFMAVFLPSYYLGHCLSYLNGFYLHYGGNPDVPIAWGVSSYHRLYNTIWFNNGYHAEHHYRPKVHWTEMKALHAQLAGQQEKAGVRVIRPPHALGFLERNLPNRSRSPNRST